MQGNEANQELDKQLWDMLDATVGLLGEVCNELEARTYPDPQSFMHEAAVQIARVAYRDLRAAIFLFDNGYSPECGALIRPVFELGVDLAFLLSCSGSKRQQMAKQYIAARKLRHNEESVKRYAETNPQEFALAASMLPERARRANRHWTGLDKSEVRADAQTYWDNNLGTDPKGYLKLIVFDFGSMVAHGDPGSWTLYPLNDASRIQLGEHGKSAWLRTALIAALVLVNTAAKRLSDDAREKAMQLMVNMHDLSARIEQEDSE